MTKTPYFNFDLDCSLTTYSEKNDFLHYTLLLGSLFI